MKTSLCHKMKLAIWLLLFSPSLVFARSYGSSVGEALFYRFAIGGVISLVVFLIFREAFCWYWKINVRLSLEKERVVLLKEISKKLSNLSVGSSPAAIKTVDQELQEQDEIEMAKVAKVKEVIDMYLKEDYSFKHGEELDELVKRKEEAKCLHCGKRLPTEISSFCSTGHREAFFKAIDKYIER